MASTGCTDLFETIPQVAPVVTRIGVNCVNSRESMGLATGERQVLGEGCAQGYTNDRGLGYSFGFLCVFVCEQGTILTKSI